MTIVTTENQPRLVASVTTASYMTLAAFVGASIAHSEKATMTEAELIKTRQLTRAPRFSASSVGPLLISALDLGARLGSSSSRGRPRSTAPKRPRSIAAVSALPLGVDPSSATPDPSSSTSAPDPRTDVHAHVKASSTG